jgi:pimeloyl-ACP methyl ester carboxylesterase
MSILALIACAPLQAAPSEDVVPRALPREERTFRAGDATYASDVGRVVVLADRSQPKGARIELAVARLKGRGPERAAPIVFLAGGPGDGATGMVGNALWKPYLELGDVLLIDQRGTGRSQPSLIVTPKDFDPRSQFGERPAAQAALLAACKTVAEDLAASGVNVSAYTTTASADDVVDVLDVLGYERARILSHSYGTHWTLELMRRHPARVERCALLGVAGPDDLLKPAGELQPFVDLLARRAASVPELKAKLPDLAAALASVLERAKKEPYRVNVPDPETGGDVELAIGSFGLQRILLIDLGDSSDLVVMPRLLAELAAGDTSTLAWFAAKRYGGMRRLNVAAFALRGSSGVSDARRERIEKDARTSPFEDTRNFPFPEVLDVFAIRPAPAAFREPVKSAVPCLLVSGTLDANTPPNQADAVARGLSKCGRLVVENAGHDDLLFDPRIRERIVAFLGGAGPTDARLEREPYEFAPLEGASKLHPSLEKR